MIEIGRAYLNFEYHWRSQKEFEAVASRAFDIAEEGAREFLAAFGAVDVHVTLAEGSGRLTARFLKVGKVAVASVVIYGGLRTGIDYVERDVRRAASYVIDRTTDYLELPPTAVRRARRDATLPRKIRNIVEQVERGELTSGDATRRITELIRGDEEPSAEDLAILRHEISKIPVRPHHRTDSLIALPSVQHSLQLPDDTREEDTPRKRLPRERPMPGRKVEVVREGPRREKRLKRRSDT